MLRPRGARLLPQSGTNPLSLLAIGVGGGGEDGFETRLAEVRAVLAQAEGAAIAPYLSGESILIVYAGPAEAAAAARLIHGRLRDRMPLRIAGHHGLIACVRDPFLDVLRPAGGGVRIVEEIAASIPADTICVSGDFAAVLAATRGGAGRGQCDRRDPGRRRRLADRPLRAQIIGSALRAGAARRLPGLRRRVG